MAHTLHTINNEDRHIPNQHLQWNNVYFIGIGGIGMSALARYFVAKGCKVAGYDKSATTITQTLEHLGVAIHFEDSERHIPQPFKDKATTLIVYTPAIPESNNELSYFKTHHFKIEKRSKVLGDITRDTFCFAVAGTHGKTTTTSILGHLLKASDVEMTAFLGGISENYNSNFIENGTNVTVVEADEYDRSFLNLTPDYAAITSMDADHLDIYDNPEILKRSFEAFARCIKPAGKLFVNENLPLTGISYGFKAASTYSAQNVNIVNGTYHFDIKTPTETLRGFIFHLPGKHNISNAVLALAMALEYGVASEQLIKALASYKGVKRRFTYHIKRSDVVFIDDYAHHPEEIKAVYNAIKEMYPNDKIMAIFQPHLFSRTRDFGQAFANVLSKFDQVVLLDIYPARELPIEGVTSEWLLAQIDNDNKVLVSKAQLIETIQQRETKIVLTIGAGDIGEEVRHITQALSYEA